jgi:4'-phosphopantetheinyl transferase EntD
VVFSLKEGLFKCLYPLGRTMFYFLAVELEAVDVNANGGAAKLRLLRPVGTGELAPESMQSLERIGQLAH